MARHANQGFVAAGVMKLLATLDSHPTLHAIPSANLVLTIVAPLCHYIESGYKKRSS